jgi:hypothetical protein
LPDVLHVLLPEDVQILVRIYTILDFGANFGQTTGAMQRWLWLALAGLVIVGGLIFWWARQASAPSSETYRASVLEVLRGRGGLDPGLAFILRGLRVDLDCRDEELCTRGENFSYVYDITEQYENLLGDYWGRICRRLKPSEADRADHEQLCHLLDALFKEVRGIKTKAAQALGLLQHSPKETVQPLLRGVLQRILTHRERVLSLIEELHQITWLEPVLSVQSP